MVPPPRWPPLCTLPPGPGPPRFVCYCEGEGGGPGEHGGFNLCVTDAAELWSTCFTPDRLAALKARFGLSATEDIALRFRAACERQAVTLTLQEDRASLTLSGGPSALELDLSKVPGPEAASRLQALTLDLAERVCSLEQRLAGLHSCFPPPSCCSRGDGHQPQKERLAGGASSLLTRPRSSERWPWTWGQEAVSRGVSHQPRLQEKPAGGVDFDDP
ncbi:protein PAXX isoform X3 [Cervus elaphus]|uniref:protein PAXX isoform X3 n=1 Tax=Cervus canadensis TaxID=1574408 RepID=UPI001C9E2F8F|nr:protein PAXX isoform X3 [Cervus canadensis]XP_043772203.1 protein PAXX isoform X3 [Cervus elaphus]